MTHPHPNRRFVPQAVLTRSGKINTAGASVNTAGARINTTVRPVNTAGSKPTMNHPRSISNTYKKGYSQVTRLFNTNKNSIFNKTVNIVKVKDTIARYRAVVSENKGKGANAVKASACWVWKAKNSSASNTFKKYSYIDALGRSKSIMIGSQKAHMTGNKCYLTEYEDYDGYLFCPFGDGKGRISRKGFVESSKKDNITVVARRTLSRMVLSRRNRTLIEAARTMLVDSKLPTTFWAEAVNTACYVLNKVLVIKPHTKTPYELIRGITPLIDFMKPFGCPVTILNTKDHLGKFDEKADEGFFVGYYVVSKAMRVFNKRTRIVEETLNVRFLENAHNVTGNRPDWLFDVDSLSKSMNYVTQLLQKTQTNDPKISEEDAEEKPTKMDESGASNKDRDDDQATRSEFERLLQQEQQTIHPNSTNSINTVSTTVITAGPSFTDDDLSLPVNVAEASNAFEEHLFEQFSPFKNALHTYTCFKCDSNGFY
ncbi:retrovirus-related pol polyprotein from transposon TNT 1-94 [Tanacetum coccineum]|uniref:Retrovirus-related pol polyprotein from transposon TNT 1-94 n=1 Tax=Tanacetum coccineum TaxID=301880 RepID=A0ABQ5DWU2_9ASTR